MDKNRKIVKVCHVVSADIMLRFLLLEQIKYLERLGLETWGVCSDGKWVDEIEKTGVRIKTIEITRNPFTPLADLTALILLIMFFRKEHFDIVHTYSPKAGFLGRIAAKVAGVPIIIYTNLGFYFHEDSPPIKRRILVFLEKITGRFSTLIFSVNKEDIEIAIREKIALPETLKYFGGWVKLDRFRPEKFPCEFIERKKNELGISSRTKVIGIVARLVKEKGYFELFEAFREITKRYPDTILLVVGQAEPHKKDGFVIDDISREYGIEKHVMYLGERTDVEELLSLMDVFVLPSRREGIAISILEASAMKKPVVATNIRGCREAVDNGVTGILVPTRDSKKLAEALLRLLSNSEEAKEMGEAGRKKMEREFDEKLVFARLEKEYRRLIKEKLSRNP